MERLSIRHSKGERFCMVTQRRRATARDRDSAWRHRMGERFCMVTEKESYNKE
jgi:hypothetical protein